MKKYTVNARTTEIKIRLDRLEADLLTAEMLNRKVDAQIERSMNGDPDESYEFDTLEEALKKFEELKTIELTVYHESNGLLDVYQVYIDEDEVDEDGCIDFGDTIRFFTNSNVRWVA